MGVELNLYIDGQKVTEPIEWQGMKITAAYGDNSNQPSIESDRFTLIKDAAQKVLASVDNGDIFEGLEAMLEYKQGSNQITLFDGFLDTSDNLEILEPTFGATDNPNQLSVKFRGKDTITNFLDQIDGVTYGYMYESGVITDSDFTDINTVIVKRASFMEVAMAIVTIYLLQKQLKDSIKEVATTVSDIIAIFAGGITGGVAAAAYSIAIAIIQIAYTVAMIGIIIGMVKNLISLLIPPTVVNKGIKYRTMLSKVCQHYGYTFVSPISELDTYHYLPTKGHNNEDNILSGVIPLNQGTKIGVPSTGDFGYIIPEMFELCKRMFWAKIDVIGNEVHLRNTNDPFWLQSSTYVPPININFPSKRYNTQELNQTRLTTFITDTNDEWTIENYQGTSYEIKTEPTNINNIKNVVIKGLDRTDLPVALPNCKTKLDNVEEIILNMATVADSLISAFGGSGTLASQINQNRINVLKVSQNDYNVPKCVPLINGHLPPNHRNLLSAKFLVNKYHGGKSFVTGGKLGQKLIYNGVRLPFNLQNFTETLHNGTFVLPDGRTARFREVPYVFSEDIAEVDIEVQEVYTNKLKEIYYEPF